MLIKSIFAGFGGQGVLAAGYALANAAMVEGRHVTFLPSYGAEMRGGTANCTVAISDEEIASPVASAPEYVVAFNTPSLVRFQNHIQTGGQLFLNATLVTEEPHRLDVGIFRVPASEIAEKLDNPRGTNVVMLGAFVKVTRLVAIESVIAILPEVFGAGRKNLIAINEQCLRAGYDSLEGAENGHQADHR